MNQNRMSILSAILRRSFCTSQAPSSEAKDALLKSITYNECNLRRMVDTLKEPSQHARFRYNKGPYGDTISRLAAVKRFDWIEELLEEKKKHDDISRESYAVKIIALYGRSGMFQQASKVFDELPELKCERTVFSFNALLGACVNCKKFNDEAETFFEKLSSEMSITPNIFSYNIMMKGHCEMGSFDSAFSLLEKMEKKRVAPDLVTYNTLLHCLYSMGRISDAEDFWARMEAADIVPDARSYNAKLIGLGIQKRMSDAVSLFEELKSKGIKATVFTYNNLIRGYCNAGNLEEGMKWFEKMKAIKCGPDKATFKILITCACENRNFDVSLKLCKKIVKCRSFMDPGLFELVLDGLVKESRTDEAIELVELANSNNHCNYMLKMPSSE